MKFNRYSSIENHYQKKFIDSLSYSVPLNYNKWIVQEKVHGANFSFTCDGVRVIAGKRSSFIGDGGNFYNSSELIKEVSPKILKLFHSCELEGISSITVYGELYGGSYKHPDVPNVNVKSIQSGVYYSPNINFIAYDILDNTNEKFIDLDIAQKLCSDNGVPFTEVLFKGTLEQCMQYEVNGANSTIYKYHDLPAIPDNEWEGVVIKPTHEFRLFHGGRAIIKKKTSNFSERKVSKESQVPKNLPQNIIDMVVIAEQYINENRFNNVASKLGESPKDNPKVYGRFIGMFNQDVIEDFIKDNSEQFLKLEKSEQKSVTREINAISAKFIKQSVINS